MQKDIDTLDDIKFLVDSFYNKISTEPLIGPVFNKVLGGHWEKHLDKMYRFWQTILLEEVAYSGSPFLVHADLPIKKAHFDAWLKLWNETINEFFKGPRADEAKWRADKMSEMFQFKLEHYRNSNAQPLI